MMATKDSRNIFERVYTGMNALCGKGTLSERLEWVLLSISPLHPNEFPEFMRNDFTAVKTSITAMRDSGATDQDRERLAENYVKLYTKAARLDGVLQDVIGGSS